MSRWWVAVIMLPLLLAGCVGASARPAFPADNAVAGWTQLKEDGKTLTGDALANQGADLGVGLADPAGQYAVEALDRQRYANASGDQLDVQVWRMADAAEAFGLWSALRGGSRVAGLGNDADSDGARRLGFWQGRYFVQVLAGQDVSAQELEEFGAALAKTLPKGGEPPALAARLPQAGLVPDSTVFFHQEPSLQTALDLGGQNLLGLSPKTDGVLAGYTLDGQPYRLLLVEYPQAGQAAEYLPVLQNMGLAGLLVSGAQDGKLAAVFGEQSSDAVVNLLAEALK